MGGLSSQVFTRHINYKEWFALLDTVLLIAIETALTRAASDERRRPCRGGIVHIHHGL